MKSLYTKGIKKSSKRIFWTGSLKRRREREGDEIKEIKYTRNLPSIAFVIHACEKVRYKICMRRAIGKTHHKVEFAHQC